jgi:hypothetical protein
MENRKYFNAAAQICRINRQIMALFITKEKRREKIHSLALFFAHCSLNFRNGISL